MSTKTKSTKRSLYKLSLLLFLIALFLFVAVYILVFRNKHTDLAQPAPEQGSVADVSRPTDDEKAAADAQKQKNIDRLEADNNTPSSSDGRKQVTPYITFLEQTGGNIEAGGLISGIYENTGTCTLTATNGTNKITKQSPARKNPSTTDCLPFSIPEKDFTVKGNWTFVLNYDSPNAFGSSQSRNISIK